MKFYIQRGDTSRSIKWQVELNDGETLAGAAVRFRMMNKSGKTVVDAAGIVLSEADGLIAYNWGDNDLKTPGLYSAVFTVTWSDGSEETFPWSDYIEVVVGRNVDPK